MSDFVFIANKVTEWVIYAVGAFAGLPVSLPVVPFINDKPAAANRLVVKVVIQRHMLEADEPYFGQLTFIYKTTDRAKTAVEDIWGRIETAMMAGLQNTETNAKAIETFSRLDLLTEDSDSTTDNTPNFRVFTRTIPLHVKLL